MILFDTDTVTHFAYGNANVRRRIEETGDEELAVALITRIEIVNGRAESLLKAANEGELRIAADRFRRAEALLAGFAVVDFDDESFRQFGRLRNQKKLNKMGRADMLIAYITLAHDALLVTRNARAYRDVAGLRTKNWVD